ncbi:MAG: glycosyltransferase, partial [Ferruginibacter sp.]|nr:glycosyltransferase [Ferruginibacter sp.]
KWEAYVGCEAFVLPSHQENFGIAVVEALACSKPVLISDQVNIWKEIQDAGAGIVAPDTLEGTKQLLLSWLHMNTNDRAEIIGNTRRCYEKKFTVKAAAENMYEAIKSL